MSGRSPLSLTKHDSNLSKEHDCSFYSCWWDQKDRDPPQWFTCWVWGENLSCYCILLELPVHIQIMVLYFLDRNSSLTLAIGLVCRTGQSQRVALLREMKTGKETSHLIAWWGGWRSMKTLMGAFVSLKHMLVFLLFTNRMESVFYQWRALAQWMWIAWQSRSSIASSPRIEMH